MDDELKLSADSPSASAQSGEGVAEHTLRGEIEKILFESDDSSYSVIRMRDAQGNAHTVFGPVTGAYPGQGIEVTGRWEMHKEHGRQLRAVSYSYTLPSTSEGIIKYLSSGVIKGIGEKYAEAIVLTFGAQTLEVLDKASARLKEVPGLGKKRIESIRKAWKENAERRELQIYMQSIGISLAYFNRIYKLYGDNSANVLRDNPYRLASEVDGIGFLMSDRIAANMGIQKGDQKRLKSGVAYALSQVRLAGHVCLPETDFIRMLCELLDVEETEAENALRASVNDSIAAIRIASDSTRMVYEPGLLRCEDELPALLSALMRRKKHCGEALSRFKSSQGSKFSPEQLRAVDTVAYSPVSIITGGPGVGKTTVVSEIVRRARAARLNLVLAAPTGRAAKRMSEATGNPASTIHRMLKWDPLARRFIHGRTNPLPYELYVLDEVSMLDLPLSVAFFRAVRPGATVVLVGDSDQLPSVGPGNILNDLIESQFIPVTRLTKIFRQGAGSGIIQAAHAVNQGRVPFDEQHEKSRELSDFYWIEKDTPEETADIIQRLITERIPARFDFDIMNDVQLLCPMNRGVCGTIAMNERLQALLNPDPKPSFKQGERLFKLGDRVMQTSNNYDKGVFNGDMGRITSINHGDSVFTVRYDNVNVDYEFFDAEQLTLSYAVTVHKSQGSEFKAVIMPLLSQHYMMLQRNLLYTGITRAKQLMILIGSQKAVSMAVRNSVREPRYSLLNERLRASFGKEM